MPFDLFRFLIDIETGNFSHPGGRCRKAAQHTHGSRLAGSVRSQETENLPLAYREADMVDGGKGTEAFRQFICFYYIHNHKAIKQSSIPGFIGSMPISACPFAVRNACRSLRKTASPSLSTTSLRMEK